MSLKDTNNSSTLTSYKNYSGIAEAIYFAAIKDPKNTKKSKANQEAINNIINQLEIFSQSYVDEAIAIKTLKDSLPIITKKVQEPKNNFLEISSVRKKLKAFNGEILLGVLADSVFLKQEIDAKKRITKKIDNLAEDDSDFNEMSVMCVLKDVASNSNNLLGAHISMLNTCVSMGVDTDKKLHQGISINDYLKSFPEDIQNSLNNAINSGFERRKNELCNKYMPGAIPSAEHHILCILKDMQTSINTANNNDEIEPDLSLQISELSKYKKGVDMNKNIHAPNFVPNEYVISIKECLDNYMDENPQHFKLACNALELPYKQDISLDDIEFAYGENFLEFEDSDTEFSRNEEDIPSNRFSISEISRRESVVNAVSIEPKVAELNSTKLLEKQAPVASSSWEEFIEKKQTSRSSLFGGNTALGG